LQRARKESQATRLVTYPKKWDPGEEI
jgi:hypothetical protein